MSLFRTKDWWRVGETDLSNNGSSAPGFGPEREEVDGLAFTVANLDNDPSGQVKMAVGNLQGMLRIYAPKESSASDPASSAASEESLLEVDLQHPILQLESGFFSPDYDMCLAVLHPRLLTVYLLTNEGGSQDMQNLSLQKLYEHKLERSAANMACGPFGRSTTNDFICVQSLDGQLSIYEQSTFAFARFLAQFVLPGPLCYCEDLDCFFTVNSAFELECYKYQTLTSATFSDNNTNKDDKTAAVVNNSFKHGKKLEPNWRFILGEGAIDIKCCRFSRGLKKVLNDVVVLGERTLFVISSDGESKLQKKLEYPPACLAVCPLNLGQEQPVCNIMIATSTGYLMVYDNERLIWSARHDIIPVALQVVSLAGLNGLIATLSENGALAVSFLGTDPPTQVVSTSNEESLNFEEMESEHRQLLNVIRQHATEKPPEPVDQLMIRAQIPQYMKALGDESSYGIDSRMDYGMEEDDDGVPTKAVVGRIFLNFSGIGEIKDVSISALVPEPLSAELSSTYLPSIKGSSDRQTPVIIELKLFPGKDCVPVERTLNISASYMTSTGEPRITHCEVQLPLCLFGSLVNPVKNATYKITLDTNRDAPQLVNIFEDIFAASQENYLDANANVNVMSFKYFSGEIVTTIVSKNAGRYRIQSDSNGVMWLILKELKERLAAYFAAADQDQQEGQGEPFRINLNDSVPLEQFFRSIDEHFSSVEYVNKLHGELELHGKRFRAVQKRLLVRFKDRKPEPLNHLEALLDDTYDKIVDCCTQIDESTFVMNQRGRDVVYNCHLFLSLLQCQFNLSDKDITFLRKFVSPQLEHNQGGYTWEEYTESSLQYLLKAHLSKSQKDTITFGGISKMNGTAKLKKLISSVVERFARGISLKIG